MFSIPGRGNLRSALQIQEEPMDSFLNTRQSERNNVCCCQFSLMYFNLEPNWYRKVKVRESKTFWAASTMSEPTNLISLEIQWFCRLWPEAGWSGLRSRHRGRRFSWTPRNIGSAPSSGASFPGCLLQNQTHSPAGESEREHVFYLSGLCKSVEKEKHTDLVADMKGEEQN